MGAKSTSKRARSGSKPTIDLHGLIRRGSLATSWSIRSMEDLVMSRLGMRTMEIMSGLSLKEKSLVPLTCRIPIFEQNFKSNTHGQSWAPAHR